MADLDTQRVSRTPVGMLDRALQRILAEIEDGLRHGYFEFALSCEVISQDRRRLTLRAGKNYQFVLPLEDCLRSSSRHADSHDGSDTNEF